MTDKEQLKTDWLNLVRASEEALMNGKDRDVLRAGAKRIAIALDITAGGGPISSDKACIAGERGAETIVPKEE